MDVNSASIQNHHSNKNVKFVKMDFTLNHQPENAENVIKDVKSVMSKNVKKPLLNSLLIKIKNLNLVYRIVLNVIAKLNVLNAQLNQMNFS